ncbi:hypothetical protein Gohar_028253 [Gossypium harknessii]|uniref:Uncharacterized protein n=1 Tax=Gossypium harknessii TaxID=34285 RepID=A0A7J9I5I0_9ROSI|nr:hypothetical protein [Gossypium harknessii]
MPQNLGLEVLGLEQRNS